MKICIIGDFENEVVFVNDKELRKLKRKELLEIMLSQAKLIEELEKERGINKEYLLESLEAALVTAYKRNFDSAENVKVTMDAETGDIRVFSLKQVVENVENDMKRLLADYHRKQEKTVEDLIDFHVRFERIHPFQDGNGRVGRLILFKECLKYNIVPIIIEDRYKMFYYRGLREYEQEKGYLVDTCLNGQDMYRKWMEYFEVKNEFEVCYP